MKIIAVTGEASYLVELSVTELKKLAGHVVPPSWQAMTAVVGNTYEIIKAWSAIQALQTGKDDLPKIANKLRALADLLEPITCEIPNETRV